MNLLASLASRPKLLSFIVRNLAYIFTVCLILGILRTQVSLYGSMPWFSAAAACLIISPVRKPLLLLALGFLSIRLLVGFVFLKSIWLLIGFLACATVLRFTWGSPAERHEALLPAKISDADMIIDMLVWGMVIAILAWT